MLFPNSPETNDCTPPDIKEAAMDCRSNLLPTKSKERYELNYDKFKAWCERKKVSKASENVVLAYFKELSEKQKSLWPTYSMLKSTLLIKENVDIKKYASLLAFLKRKTEGYVPKKSKVLTIDEIDKFLKEAPDSSFLMFKVALIIAVTGACRCDELVNLNLKDMEIKDDIIIVNLLQTKTNVSRTFPIINPSNGIDYMSFIRRYLALRPKNATSSRFFLRYLNGKCLNQPVGKNVLAQIGMKIATFLGLPDAKLYTGHCMRRTSATLLANAGASMTVLKRHGAWKSSSVAEGYIETSMNNKVKVTEKIFTSYRKEQNIYKPENTHSIIINNPTNCTFNFPSTSTSTIN